MSKGSIVDLNVVVLQIAERMRDKATDEGRIPFLSGDLRKSVNQELTGYGTASIGSNLSYARAVHDGRPAITIRPKGNRKNGRLRFKVGGKIIFAKEVHQPAREGKPFLREAADEIENEGYDFLDRYLVPLAEKELVAQIKGGISIDFSL